jgi:hypothetical protein
MKSNNINSNNNQKYEKVSQNDDKNEIILFQQRNTEKISVSCNFL